MAVTLEEAKGYLRVDSCDEDGLVGELIGTAGKLCRDIARIDTEEEYEGVGEIGRPAVLYALGYLYEHREEADHRGLTLTLRALLGGVRKEGF